MTDSAGGEATGPDALDQKELDVLLAGFTPTPGVDEKVTGGYLPSGVLLISIRGRTMGASALEVIDRIEELVRDRKSNIVIDLSECQFLSSMAISVLAKLAAGRRDYGAKVSFCCANEHVRKVLRLVGCQELFELREDCEAAIRDAVRDQDGTDAD